MTSGKDPLKEGEKPAPPLRGGLRLIKSEPEVDPAELAAKERPGLKNPLVKFMSSYADAIDREIQAILDL